MPNPILDPMERVFRITRQMIPGTLAGRVRSASPVEYPPNALITHKAPPALGTREILFSKDGAVSVTTSPRYYPPEDIVIASFAVMLKTAGSTTTTVRLLRNGTAITGSSVNLVSSDNFQIVEFAGVSLAANADYLQVDVTAAGTGAAGLVGSVRRSS